MFRSLGHRISNAPRAFLVVALLLTIFAGVYGKDVMQRLTLSPGWDVPGSGSALARQAVREQYGHDETAVILLFQPQAPTFTPDDPEYRRAVEAVLDPIGNIPGVLGIDSYFHALDPALRSHTGGMTYAIVRLTRGSDEGIATYQTVRQHLASDRLRVTAGGELATYMDVREQLTHDVERAEWISFGILAVLLVWVFRSVVAALMPLMIGVVTVILSTALLKFCALFTDITIYAANVVSMLGLGLAIDYGLFIVSRFREELAHGHTPQHALGTTMATAGHTVAFSGVTVASSLFCLLLLPQQFFQNMGLAGGLSVIAAMLTAILLLPPLLVLLGERINYCAIPQRKGRARVDRGRWERFSYWVMHNARAVLVVSILLLGFFGLPILHMQIGPADSRSLPVAAESRQVQQILEQSFPRSGMSPLILSVQTQGPAHLAAGLTALDTLTRQINALPGITRVDSLVTLSAGMSLADYQLFYQHPEQFPAASIALQTYAKGHQTLVLVRYTADPITPEARQLVRQLRAMPLPPGITTLQIGGFPAEHLDYVESLVQNTPWVMGAIMLVIGILLFLMLGSVFLPLKAILTNIISLTATFGGLVWVFQDGNMAGLLGFTPQGQMEGTVLVLIFATAFGLSIDYEVFLLSRIKESCHRSGDSVTSIATGIQKSGPIITSAALLIGVVLASFAMGEVVFMKAMGLGLLFSVIIDATLVRMLLVPASLRLLGRYNWWAPPFLQRIYQRFNLSEHDTFTPRDPT
jgi:trehalose monomycolate/heme transporter